MGMYKGIEYQWTGKTGVVYHHGDMYPIDVPKSKAKLDREYKDKLARRTIDDLIADRNNVIRPLSKGQRHTQAADAIMDNLRTRKGILDGVDNDILDEIHEEIRSELAKRYI